MTGGATAFRACTKRSLSSVLLTQAVPEYVVALLLFNTVMFIFAYVVLALPFSTL